jgi:D-lactate dehydrogenase
MKTWRDKYEHHLLLKMAGDGITEAQTWLTEFFKTAEGDFFACTPEEGSKAFLHRFAAAGAAIRYQAVHSEERWKIFWHWISPCDATIPNGLNICRRKLTASWYTSSITATLCAMSSIRITSLKRVDAHELKEQMLALLRERGAQYPAEHNVGHLYKAPDALSSFIARMTLQTV